jgi:hypothetical protein
MIERLHKTRLSVYLRLIVIVLDVKFFRGFLDMRFQELRRELHFSQPPFRDISAVGRPKGEIPVFKGE